jgi:hypothetical protein
VDGILSEEWYILVVYSNSFSSLVSSSLLNKGGGGIFAETDAAKVMDDS